jgi:uncharacterized protein
MGVPSRTSAPTPVTIRLLDFRSSSGKCAPSRHPAEGHPQVLIIAPRLFGSVARGDATPDSDIDLLVDLLPGGGNELLRVAGIAEELTQLLGARVDVVATSLLRGEVAASALADSVAV